MKTFLGGKRGLQFEVRSRITETDGVWFEIRQFPVGKTSTGLGYQFSYDEVSLLDDFIGSVHVFAVG